MINLISGIRSQIKQLKDRLKGLDTKKHKPTDVKSLLDDLEALEKRYEQEKSKREEKKKLKEEKSNEKAHEESKEAPKETVEASESVPVNKESDNKVEEDKVIPEPQNEKFNPKTLQLEPIKKNIEQPKQSKFDIDSLVEPVRGTSGSKGKVMRHDKPEDLVYVMWHEGPLAEREQFGGYYPSDLKKVSEEIKSERCPCWEDKTVYCPECKSQKTSDLKSNYMDMLKDLKEEHKEALDKHDHVWVNRLEQRIKDLEGKIQEKFGNEKTSAEGDKWENGSGGTEHLVVEDYTKTKSNSDIGEQDGKDSKSDYNYQWGQSNPRDLEAKNKCVICNEEFNSWPEYDAHKREKHTPKTSSLKINVFNRDWNVTPISKDASIGYDVSDNTGKKVMHIKPANGKEWSEAEIKAAIHNELTHGFKQGKLTEKIAFLEKGSKVVILATSKDKKQVKFANLEQGIRGWIPSSKVRFITAESQEMKHGDHVDEVLGSRENECLTECPKGSGKIGWKQMGELLPTTPPPATPESLNPEASSGVYKNCKHTEDSHWNNGGTCGANLCNCRKYEKDQEYKEALKTALPPTIPNQRGYLDNPPVDKQADEEEQSEEDIYIHDDQGQTIASSPAHGIIAKQSGDDWEMLYADIDQWMIDNNFYPSVWWVSDHGNVHKAESFYEWQSNKVKHASLNKQATVVHRSDGWHVLSEKGKNLGGPYKSKGEAVKRLRQVEYFKHQGSQKPFSKKEAQEHFRCSDTSGTSHAGPLVKHMHGDSYTLYCDKHLPSHLKYNTPESKVKTAEVLTDPYQALQTQVQGLRDRMSLVQERLQSNPLPKEAGEGEKDNSEMDIPSLLEDLSMGIDLLETKLQGDKVEEDVHPAIEEMENLLWSVEEKLGITPKLSEEEKVEPEHAEIVKELEKEAAPVPVSPSVVPTPSTPSVQSTDDDLEVPTQMPTSPLPVGQKWTWDAVNGKYVAMTDPSVAPGKII